MKDCEIPGGATIWARRTLESEIFHKNGDWFKIWFYLVNRVSHKDTKRYKRGETFLLYEWVCEATDTTKDQVKKCVGWLRDMGMVSTARSTRGVTLKILNYSHYQDLNNYYYKVKAPVSALEKHQRSTPILQECKECKEDTSKTSFAGQSTDGQSINTLIGCFKSINPAYKKWFANKTQRAALKRLLGNPPANQDEEDNRICRDNKPGGIFTKDNNAPPTGGQASSLGVI